MNAIELKNISVKFKQLVIFEDMSFSYKKNGIIGIVGENGSGKSVLFKLIAGFIIPNKGEIIINGVNITKEKSFPKNLGGLIEEPSFLPNITGFENLKLLASIKNDISDDKIRETLKIVGLLGKENVTVKNYSLGMKKKLGIAQAIMEDQKLILLDEPMNALDEDSVQDMRKLFKKLAKEGATILIASHNREDINELCDDVYRIKDCRLTQIELPQKIK